MSPNRQTTRLQRWAARTVTVTLCTAVIAAHAETVRYYSADQIPDPIAVATILGVSNGSRPGIRTRSIGALLNDPAARGQAPRDAGRDITTGADSELALNQAAQQAVARWNQQFPPASSSQPAPAPQPPRALAVAVQFENNSAVLGPQAHESLNAIAKGMHLAGFARPFVIEGHTSITGSLQHNMALSLARAQSVQRYLVTHGGIPSSALRTEGKGPRALLNTKNPAAPENRRVQFRAA